MGARRARRVPEADVIDAANDRRALASFRHRRDYAEVSGRDRWTVRAVNAWVSSVAAAAARVRQQCRVRCSTSGVAEQPFRPLIEAQRPAVCRHGRRPEQHAARWRSSARSNRRRPRRGRLPSILCTEVLEHVADIDAAFAGLRRLDRCRWRRRPDRAVRVSAAHGTVRFPSTDAARDTAAGRRSWLSASNARRRSARCPMCWRRSSRTRRSCRRRGRCTPRSRSARCGLAAAGAGPPARLRACCRGASSSTRTAI